MALKEALINAIAHRDYINKGTHIQVEVFDDRVSITNFGGLANGLSVDELKKRSVHRNPNIVNLLHRSNFIEKLGTGLLRIDSELKKAGLPKAELEINEHWFSIVFSRTRSVQMGEAEMGEVEIGERVPKHSLSDIQNKILLFCIPKPRSRAEIFNEIGMSNETRNFNNNIQPLMQKGLLNMTEPDKPRSRNQKYVTSKAGKILSSKST